MGDYPGYDPDAIPDEVDEEDAKKFQQWRDIDVVLIDAQPSMFQEAGIEAQGIEKSDTWFGIAMKVVRSMLKLKVISSPNDQTAVIFYGTRESKNSSDRNANTFEHVYLFQEMRVPSARRIRECEDLMKEGVFGQDIGSKSGRSAEHLRYGLWLAQQQLQGSAAKANKKVYIFSNNLDPSVSAKTKDKDQVQARISELSEVGTAFDLTPMVLPPEMAAFRHSKFWQDVMPKSFAEDTGDQEDTTMLPSVMLGISNSTRYKAYKKRPLRSTRMTFGADFSVGVQLFATVKAANKSSHTWVSAQRHEPLRSEGAEICEDTGAQLTAAQLQTRVFPKQANAGKTRFPQVFAKVDELNEMKQMVPEGLHMLGFKPLSSLKDYHQLREPTFVYPDEKRMPGSTSAFIALHGEVLRSPVICTTHVAFLLLKMRFMAVAGFSRGTKDTPKLVALLPVQEVLDEFGCQYEAPGLAMVQLPFLDDIRMPEADPNWVGEGHPTPDEAAVDAAADMIAALQLPDYFSGSVANPSLQRHYQVLEALALDEVDTLEADDEEPLPDPTMPDSEVFQSAVEQIQVFKDAAYGHGFTADLDGKGAKKSPAKRKAADLNDVEQQAADETDWAGLLKSGGLGSMTVAQLKIYLKQHSLPVSGKKADLLGRIEQHLASAAK